MAEAAGKIAKAVNGLRRIVFSPFTEPGVNAGHKRCAKRAVNVNGPGRSATLFPGETSLNPGHPCRSTRK
jgi:hypothetical protein